MLSAAELGAHMVFGVGTAVAGSAAWRLPVVTRVRPLRDRSTARSCDRGVAGVSAKAASRVFAPVIEVAGWSLAPHDALTWWAASTAATALVLGALAPLLAAGAMVMAVATLPCARWWARNARPRRLDAQLPDLLDRVARHLRGGGTIPGALADACAAPGALAGWCQSVMAQVRVGLPFDVALASWTEPGPATTPALRTVGEALRVAWRAGGPAASPLEGLAAGLRDGAAVTAEARALATQARLSAAVIALGPLGFLAFSVATGGSEVAFLTGSIVGRACAGTGLLLDGLAALWMRRIVAVAR